MELSSAYGDLLGRRPIRVRCCNTRIWRSRRTPCVVIITPRFVRIIRAPRLLIPLLVKYLNVCRNEPRRFCGISLKGGSCSGYRPPLFGVVSLNSNSPLMRRVVSRLLPLSPQPFIRWQICLCSVAGKNTRNPCLPADPFLFGLECDQLL